ncbi:putative disease resistance protein At3g14460 [Corylus avellana]|uniref:putative disease resistance protein At3g14460 n=1 Tax=Corylus avellana TaxID=13451 RepID=UPI00286CDAD9|nr:putative disease resistance protein At3g14460 [Corylus avellana]
MEPVKEFIVAKVGEFVLSKLLESLYDRLAVPKFWDFLGGKGKGLQANLDKWRQKLQDIQEMLDDAEEKQYTDRVPGRDKDKEALVELLVGEKYCSDAQLSVIPILEFTYPIEGLILEGPTHVKYLDVENCEELTPLWSNEAGLLQSLPLLSVLMIRNDQKQVSMAEEVKEQPKQGMPSTRNGMESLPKEIMYNNTCLERIEINGCDSLTHIARGQLPPTLKRLQIQNCKKMLILLDEDENNSCSSSTSLLEYMYIYKCPSLKSLTSEGELPATLQDLTISECGQLESIAESFHHNSSLKCIRIWNCENLKSLPRGIHTLSHLDKIIICCCPALVSFPDGGLLPGNLRELRIENMALRNCIHNITSLQILVIWSPPSVVVVSSFPANLTSLTIKNCNFTEALLEWGLTSLKYLDIDGGCPNVESFPEKMLSASLTTLIIERFHNLKYLSSLRNLTSLEMLYIKECENLTSFPEEGLPPSLQRLYIKRCPLLKEHCKKDQGREWFKIAHIRVVKIDKRFIYEPED